MGPAKVEQQVIDLWDFDELDASSAAFASAATRAGPTSAKGLVMRTQQARALGLLRRIKDGHEALDAVEADLRAHASVNADEAIHHVQARLEIERGRLLNSAGSPAAARRHFENAYLEATTARLEGLAVDALHMQAIVAGRIDGSAAASALNAQAVALAEQSSDSTARRWLGSLLNNLGWDRHGAGCYEEALGTFQRAVDVRIEQGSDREVEIARWCVGRCLRSLQRYAEALKIQMSLVESESGSQDGYVHEEIGETLLALGRGPEAAGHFARAHELLVADDWFADNESDRLKRLLALSSG